MCWIYFYLGGGNCYMPLLLGADESEHMHDGAARSSMALVFGARIGFWSLDLGLCDRFTTRKEGFFLLIYMAVILVILWNLNLFEKPTSVQTIHFTVSEWWEYVQTTTLTFGSSPKPHIMCCTVASMYPSIKKREKKKIAWKTSKVDSVTYTVVLLKDSSLMLTVSFQRLWRMDPPPLLLVSMH